MHEFIKVYKIVNSEKSHILYNSIVNIIHENDETEKDFIITEQRQIINQLMTTNSFYKRMAKHFRKLYLWREKN